MDSRTNSRENTKKEVVERHDYLYLEDREYKKEKGVSTSMDIYARFCEVKKEDESSLLIDKFNPFENQINSGE